MGEMEVTQFATPGEHYHYAWPHEPILCQRYDCPSWLARRLPDGRCDAPQCTHCHEEASP
jgi:hypothetical protein